MIMEKALSDYCKSVKIRRMGGGSTSLTISSSVLNAILIFSYFLSLTSTSLLEIVVCSYALKVLSVSLRADLIKSNNSSLRLSNLENLISCF